MLKAIILIGPPGSGKTTCGRILAGRLGWNFYDTDQLIQQEAGMSIPELFKVRGETHFRRLERLILERLVENQAARNSSGLVLGTGGGLPVQPGNFQLLERLGEVVCLDARLDELVKRIGQEGGRPLLASHASPEKGPEEILRDRLEDLVKIRAEAYGRARYRVDTTGLSAEQASDRIVKLLKKPEQ